MLSHPCHDGADNVDTLALYRRWASEPLNEAPKYSVVIPAYNEAERIVPTIGAIATYLSGLGEPWELIIADDGSVDDTATIVASLGLANLRLLVQETNKGKGAAVRRGVLAARAPLVLLADADQSTPIEQFDQLLWEIYSGADIAIGSRSAPGATVTNKSGIREALSRGLNFLVQTGLGLKIKDTQCGFKLFRSEVAVELFRHQYVPRFAFDLEVLYLAGKRGYRVQEVPVEWIDAPGSTVAPLRVSIEFLATIAKIRWRDRRGGYSRPVGGDPTLEAMNEPPETMNERGKQ